MSLGSILFREESKLELGGVGKRVVLWLGFILDVVVIIVNEEGIGLIFLFWLGEKKK